MKVEVLRSWRRFKPGDTFEPPDGVADVLIRRNLVKPYSTLDKVAAPMPTFEPPPKRKRGRPRKEP